MSTPVSPTRIMSIFEFPKEKWLSSLRVLVLVSPLALKLYYLWGKPIVIPFVDWSVPDPSLSLFAAAAISIIVLEKIARRLLPKSPPPRLDSAVDGEDGPGEGKPVEKKPAGKDRGRNGGLDHACYNCIVNGGVSKCGGCRLVFYCGRECQLQAWKKHRHVCGAATSSIARIQRTTKSVSPSHWRALSRYHEFVKEVVEERSGKIVPDDGDHAAEVLRKMSEYLKANPILISQEAADSCWATAISMRNSGSPNRQYMAWAWVFLEGTVESGSPDAILLAMGLRGPGEDDLSRVSRWMKRGLYQTILMMTRRTEVREFVNSNPAITRD